MADEQKLTSRRPYLIRALYDWVLDNDLTPHLLVAADAPGVDVPRQFVTEDGKITVNVAPSAVRALALENDIIRFSARFSGANYNVVVPPGAVLALYARENGEGMLFGEVEETEDVAIADSESSDDAALEESAEEAAKKKRSHLKVVK
ncbi:MAG: ClpXP protease specificity-enhancing factor [Xanthomonadales bacterium]|nr:ClpXP protease specificity-enhancing factor [Xanthomonadales bacterium]|tara:strand:- start:613 stop:1056 length:444 start_codon:yes stop_codon:yes gene_type:complete